MLQNRQRLAQLVLVATSVLLAGWIGLARGSDEASVVVDNQPDVAVDAPALIPPANAAANEPLPPQSTPKLEQERLQLQPSVQDAVKKPFLRPTEPRRVPATTALSITEEPIPVPEPSAIVESPEFEVRPAPPIEYDMDGDARKMYRSSGEFHVVMIALNPADGCHYEIPMCIPGCCVGDPRVSGGRGLLGRGVVEFCWECGFRAEVKFRKLLGDVKVEYEGD